jgi:predicted transglutaminase-like cysteine proteinase
MWVCFGTRTWRWVALLGCVVVMMTPAKLLAGAPSIGSDSSAFAAEPFGLFTVAITAGGLREKWNSVQDKLREEQLRIDACRNDRAHCSDRATTEFLTIVEVARERHGLARLGEINRAVNLAIRPVDDLVNDGQIDVWTSPLATLARGSGDCEDYAIAKMAALKEAGIAPQDLRLVILRDIRRAEDHAVLTVRLDGEWLVLDNRFLRMLRDTQLANYQPTFVIDDAGVRAYRAEPTPALVAEAPRSNAPQPEASQFNAPDVIYLVSAQAALAS